VLRVRLCVPESAVPCIPRARQEQARVRVPSVLAPDFRLPAQRVQVLVLALRLGGPVSAMFHAV